MVYYFKCIDPKYTVYMGKDQFENDELIKYAWPEDVWFHVDKHSSAHVYIRLEPNQDISSLSPNIIQDLAQLVKENSIEGKKLNGVKVVYTMATNLKKTGDMNAGEVGFHDRSKVYSIIVDKRNREIVNRLNKTKTEDPSPNFQKAREERDRQEREQKKREVKEKKIQEKREIEEKRKESEAKNYDNLFSSKKMKSNKTSRDMDDVYGDAGDNEGYGDFNDLDDFI